MGRLQLEGGQISRKHAAPLSLQPWLLLMAFMILGNRISFAGRLQEQDLKTLQLVAFEPPVEAPDFVLEDLSGKKVRLKEYRGKPVMLYFWGTW